MEIASQSDVETEPAGLLLLSSEHLQDAQDAGARQGCGGDDAFDVGEWRCHVTMFVRTQKRSMVWRYKLNNSQQIITMNVGEEGMT